MAFSQRQWNQLFWQFKFGHPDSLDSIVPFVVVQVETDEGKPSLLGTGCQLHDAAQRFLGNRYLSGACQHFSPEE